MGYPTGRLIHTLRCGRVGPPLPELAVVRCGEEFEPVEAKVWTDERRITGTAGNVGRRELRSSPRDSLPACGSRVD